MKRLFVLLALFVGLSSCSQDDAIPKPGPTPEEPVTHIKSLAGTKWQAETYYLGTLWYIDVLFFEDTECIHAHHAINGVATKTYTYTYDMPVLKFEGQNVGGLKGSTLKFLDGKVPHIVDGLEFSLVDE